MDRLSPASGFGQKISYRRNHINILESHSVQTARKENIFSVQWFVFIHDIDAFAFDFTKTAFDFHARYLKILFGYGDLQFIGQVFQCLVQLVRFHDKISYNFIWLHINYI